MSHIPTAPPLPILPPFVLPDQHGVAMNTASFRGRRNLVLMLLPDVDASALAYLRTFTVRHDEWAWLHTAIVVVTPATAATATSTGLSLLQDTGAVRMALLPDVQPDIAALFVADTEGRVAEWRTARRVDSLPDVDTVLAWAWEIARPRGACDGGVSWARPVTVPAPPPSPIGRFTIGTHRNANARYQRKR